jgi:hypothetical protein
MAKKRKDAAQSTTLDNFFTKGGTSSNKKPKLRAGTNAPAKVKKIPFNISPEQIIVIDSDDEGSRQPLVVDNSSDIEVVEGTVVADSCAASSSRATETRPVAIIAARVSTPLTAPRNNETADESTLDNEMSFGEPSLLVDENVAPPRAPAVEDGLDFGLPSLLHETPEAPFSAASESVAGSLSSDGTGRAQQASPTPRIETEDIPRRPSPRPLQRSDLAEDPLREGTSLMQRPVASATSANHWELGDDEAVISSADVSLDDTEQANAELSLKHGADRGDIELIQICPICNTLLDRFSALVGLKCCLDRPVLTGDRRKLSTMSIRASIRCHL